MKRGALVILVCLVALLAVACSTTMPVCATSNPVGSKIGQASTTQIFSYYFDGGDASIYKAAKNGGISKISTVDFKVEHVFFYLVIKYTTIVSGD